MKKFNAFSVYSLGKQVFPLLQMKAENTKLKEIIWNLWGSRAAVLEQFASDSILLDASKRAAEALIARIDGLVPRDLRVAIEKDGEEMIYEWRITQLITAAQTLETVIGNDMPGLSSYMVKQKGIYRTDDLIERADAHFLDEIRNDLPDRAREDFREAGKCLAYEVSTACAFHLWRSVETVTDYYFQRLTGKSFDDAGVQKNWGAYIKALEIAKADAKITQFLDHIRAKYRNPQMHPEEMVSVSQAFGLFGAASSAINQLVLEAQKLPNPQTHLQQVAQPQQ